MTETTSRVDIAGVVIDLAKVPSSDTPPAERGSHLRERTGPNGHYYDEEGLVARADIVVGPRPTGEDTEA